MFWEMGLVGSHSFPFFTPQQAFVDDSCSFQGFLWIWNNSIEESRKHAEVLSSDTFWIKLPRINQLYRQWKQRQMKANTREHPLLQIERIPNAFSSSAPLRSRPSPRFRHRVAVNETSPRCPSQQNSTANKWLTASRSRMMECRSVYCSRMRCQ